MGFRLRSEKSPDAIRSLTALSQQSNGIMYGFLLLIVVTGVSMGVQGGWFGHAWIWVAIVVLIVTIGAMNGLNRVYHNVRVASGVPGSQRRQQPAVAASGDQLQDVVGKANPWPISVVGIVAIVVLLWLMVLKPF